MKYHNAICCARAAMVIGILLNLLMLAIGLENATVTSPETERESSSRPPLNMFVNREKAETPKPRFQKNDKLKQSRRLCTSGDSKCRNYQGKCHNVQCVMEMLRNICNAIQPQMLKRNMELINNLLGIPLLMENTGK